MQLAQFLIYILVISFTQAWWEGGHMITVEIAKQEIVDQDPELFEKIEKYVSLLNPLSDARSQTFVQAASWADDIKDPAMNFWENWHYYNKPINPDDSLNDNSINAVKRAVQELQKNNTIPINNKENISVQQAILMRLLIHIVGDIHQPLHNTNFFNYTYATSGGDQGGNKEKLLLLNKTSMILHSYFDSGALRLDCYNRPLNADQIQNITDFAIDYRKQYTRTYFGERMNAKTPELWSQESFDIAQNFIYPFLDKTNQVTPEWEQQSYEMIKQQIAIGGYRLADLLVQIFKPSAHEDQKQNSTNTTSYNKNTVSTNFLRKVIE